MGHLYHLMPGGSELIRIPECWTSKTSMFRDVWPVGSNYQLSDQLCRKAQSDSRINPGLPGVVVGAIWLLFDFIPMDEV